MRIEIYRDREVKWRARFKASNGNIVWVTSEGYESRRSLDRAVELLLNSDSDTRVVNLERELENDDD